MGNSCYLVWLAILRMFLPWWLFKGKSFAIYIFYFTTGPLIEELCSREFATLNFLSEKYLSSRHDIKRQPFLCDIQLRKNNMDDRNKFRWKYTNRIRRNRSSSMYKNLQNIILEKFLIFLEYVLKTKWKHAYDIKRHVVFIIKYFSFLVMWLCNICRYLLRSDATYLLFFHFFSLSP